MTSAPIEFGEFRLDPREGVLLRGRRPVELPPKLFELLRYLASEPRRLLTKDAILDAVWPEQFVSDSVLKGAIAELRAALGDDAKQPRYIETVPRRGYRFVAEGRRRRLPAPLTRFVGREDELGHLRDAVGGHRLITVTGVGGSGKTRLALELAASLADEGREVLWVELAAIEPEPARGSTGESPDEPMVTRALAASVGAREHAAPDLLGVTARLLGERPAVLVLDNCEHVLDACVSATTGLLEACPRLVILATSREDLGVAGEHVLRLSPLSTDRRDDRPASSPAAELFLDRSRSAEPHFDPAEADLEAIDALCERLEGIPLAVELAASCIRYLSPAQIADHLDDALALLVDGPRSESPRHRTLEATIDWSLRLLEDDERELLADLTLFPGSFGAESLAAVFGRDRAGEVLRRVGRLVSQSMLEVQRPPGSGARYSLLEIVRQSLDARGHDPGERRRLRALHASWCRTLAEEAEPHLRSARRAAWSARLERELPDLRAALRFGLEQDPAGEDGARTAAALTWFWFFQGSWSEGIERMRPWCRAETLSAELRAKLLGGLGFLEFARGELVEAERHLVEARELDDGAHGGQADGFLAMVRLARGADPHEAVRHARRCSERLRARGDPWLIATVAANNLGNSLRARGELAEARTVYREGLETLCADGASDVDPWPQSMLIRNLGIVAGMEGDDAEAASCFRRSLALLRELGEPWFVSRGLDELAAVLVRQGHVETATRLLGASEAMRELQGAPIVGFYRTEWERAREGARAVLGQEFQTAWQEGRRLGLAEALDLAIGPDRQDGSAAGH